MTAADTIARARIPSGRNAGQIQCSAGGVVNPAHYRALLVQDDRDKDARIAALERENARLRAENDRLTRFEKLYPTLALQARGRPIP